MIYKITKTLCIDFLSPIQTVFAICIARYSSGFVRVRFAPSPTGFLHLGGLRTALYNYLFAKSKNGKFILRIEDTDDSRRVEGSAESFEDDLKWAQIHPNESPSAGGHYGPYIQSERISFYKDKINILLERGAVYRCFCSIDRLASFKKEHLPYDRKCRSLSKAEENLLLEEGRPFCIRVKNDSKGDVEFNDLIFGWRSLNVLEGEGDFILIKSNGVPTYHFASVVDDHLMDISHVFRGEDWLSSLPKHLLLYKAFGWEPPLFGHLPHISNPDGSKLSKRQKSLHVKELRHQGYSPDAVLNFIKLSGGGFDRDFDHEVLCNMDQLIDKFDLSRLNTHPAPLRLDRLNDYNRLSLQRQLTSEKGIGDAVRELQKDAHFIFGKDVDMEICEPYLKRVLLWGQNRVFTIKDFTSPSFMFLWKHPSNLPLEELPTNTQPKRIIEEVINTMSSENDRHSSEAISDCLKKAQETLGAKTAPFMKVVRWAVCGSKTGPPVAETIELLGKETVIFRLKKALSSL